MFRRAVRSGLLFMRCNAIHTFFLLVPLDVVFLDDRGKVVKVIEGLPPWRVVPPVKGARHTLELAHGSISESKTEAGDEIVLVGPIDTAGDMG